MATGFSAPAARRVLARPRRLLVTRRSKVEPALRAVTAEAGLPAPVDPVIHPDDQMYLGDPAHYFSVGLSGLRAARDALAGAEPARIVDYAGGYGRVLRFLAAGFPAADLTLAEVQPAALAFGRRRFGAEPLQVTTDTAAIPAGPPARLIWCGSLLTHLDEQRFAAVLAWFAQTVEADGVVAASVHGPFAARHEWTLKDLGPATRAAVLADFEKTGFGYAPYPGSPGYGVSLTSEERLGELAAAAGLALEGVSERAFGAHQDVAVLRRAGARRDARTR